MSKTKTISETLLQNSYYASKNNQSNIFFTNKRESEQSSALFGI